MAESVTGKSLVASQSDRDRSSYVENGKLGPARLVQNVTMGETYESDTFNVTDGTTDYDVDSNQANLFDDRTYANYVSIRTDATISVKFNSTDDDSITITTGDSPFVIDFLEVLNIFITNSSGGTASVQVILV